MSLLPDLPHNYLSEGTPGVGLSSHKALLASRSLDVDVETVGVRGPEPSHISTPEELVWEKFKRFHNSRAENKITKPVGEDVELVADVTLALGMQGELASIDARKGQPVKAVNGIPKAQILGKRVASQMRRFGERNVVAHMDAGLAVAICDHDIRAASVGVGAARSYITLPGNPMADAGLTAEYVTWSGLGEKHFDGVMPMGIDIPTYIAFLGYTDWLSKHGYKGYSMTDLVSTPYPERDQGYTADGLEFYKALGRIPEGMISVLGESLAVGLLDIAFNFPRQLVESVVGVAKGSRLIPNRVIRHNVVYARGRVN